LSAERATPARFKRQAVPKHPGVYWRIQNGRRPTPPYQAIYRNHEGRQVAKSGFPTIESAEAWLAEQRTNKTRGILVKPNSMTVQQWATLWLANHPDLSPGSRRLNEQRLRDYVYPVIGRRRLGGSNGVTKHDVLAVKRTMEAPPAAASSSRRKKVELSQNTIKGVLAMLSAMFQAAVDEDQMAFNPVRQLGTNQRKAKAKPQRRMVIVEPHEIPNLISAAAEGPHYFGVMVFAALFSGMRLGELQGLRWDDVHIHGQNKAKPYIVVHGQLLRQKDEDTGTTVFEQRGLKSKHDHITRTLRIPRQLGDHLRRWRAASPRSTGQDFVFVSAAGSPPSDSTIRSNFYRARKAAGLNPAMRFHDMRDTHASMLIRDGRPITEIAVRLGHTKKDGSPNPATTLAHYSHLFDAATSAEETCERLEARAASLQS
jgi:integrase